ncbi:MAG: hypothetical protein U0746_07175 [Gemmataceae bacterium]
MRYTARVVLSLGLAAALAGPAAAQRNQQPGGGRGMGGNASFGALLQNEAVQKELKMEKDQADKVIEAVKKVQEKHADDFAKLRDLSQDERRTKTQELTATVNGETLTAIGDMMKPEQLTRLKQIELQRAAAAGYARKEIQTALKLSDEQKDKVKTLVADYEKQMQELVGARGQGGQGGQGKGGQGKGGQGKGGQGGRGLGANQEKVTALRKEVAEKFVALLDDSQKKTWKGLTGEPFEVPTVRRNAAE